MFKPPVSYNYGNPLSFTLPNERTVLLRPYSGMTDRSAIETMCVHVFDGRDFVPSMLSTYEQDYRCLPYVLEDRGSGDILSFINIRAMPDVSTDTYFYVEGVRVAPSVRKQGIGKSMLRAVLRLVRSVNGPCVFQSITEPVNIAMESIFRSTGWTSSSTMHLWPSVPVLSSIRREYYAGKVCSSMLQRLAIPTNKFSDHAHKLCNSWYPIYTCSDILAALPQDSSVPPLIPFFFSVESVDKAVRFLHADVAEQEGRTAYRLKSGGLMLVRKKAIDQFPRCYDFVISACVSTKEEAESCVLFAETVLKFPWFYIVFGTSVSHNDFITSKVLSTLEVDSFRSFENCGEHCGKEN